MNRDKLIEIINEKVQCPICLETIERNGYTRGMYFYVRDEKILQLLSLFVSKLARVDKLVYNPNIDKQLYEQ